MNELSCVIISARNNMAMALITVFNQEVPLNWNNCFATLSQQLYMVLILHYETRLLFPRKFSVDNIFIVFITIFFYIIDCRALVGNPELLSKAAAK